MPAGTDTTEHTTLAAALSAVQASLPSVGKDKTARVTSQRTGETFSYAYADLADVAAAIHPVLSRHGLAFTARPVFHEHRYVLLGELLHGASGESLAAEFPLPDGTPQQIGSAITYGRRYLLCALTGVVADADDDGKAASQQPAQQRTRRAPKPDTVGDPDARIMALLGRIREARQRLGWNQDDVASDFHAIFDKRLMDGDRRELVEYATRLEAMVANDAQPQNS